MIGDYDSIYEYEKLLDKKVKTMVVKIPLKWYHDLIRVPDTTNEFVLLEWFEEKECTNKTIWCLGKYMRVRQYLISEQNIESIPNKKLTEDLMNNKLNAIKIGEYVQENNLCIPYIYKIIKENNYFGGEL